MNNYILNEIIKRGESVGRSIAASAGYNLLSKDLLGLDTLVYKAKSSNSDMPYVAIVDPGMKAIVHSDAPLIGENLPVSQGSLLRKTSDGTSIRELLSPSGSIFEISCPIVFMKKQLGHVILGINKSVLIEAQKKVTDRILILFGVIVVLGFFASSLLASFLIKPIKELSVGVNELKNGTTQKQLRIYSQDELGSLTRNFNEMSAQIADQKGKLNKYACDLEEAYVSIVKVVAAAIDARDSYTHGHSARVAQLSLLIGKQIGLSKDALTDLEVACLFHDVGKIKTPDSILLKPGKLSTDEYNEMKQHVEHGASILSWAPSLTKYIPSTRHHHEWHNGQGYPDGLTGENIPLFAAIIAIGDTFDAMTSDRPYRKALSEENALKEINRMSGIQFRPDLVTIFFQTGRTQQAPQCAVIDAEGSLMMKIPAPKLVVFSFMLLTALQSCAETKSNLPPASPLQTPNSIRQGKQQSRQEVHTDNLAKKHMEAGEYQKAIDIYNGECRKQPHDQQLTREYVKNLDGMRAAADKAFDAKDFASAGRIYYVLQSNYAKFNNFAQALSFDRTYLKARLSYCKKYLSVEGFQEYRNGHLNKALILWQGVLAIDPDNKDIKEAVKTAKLQQKNLK